MPLFLRPHCVIPQICGIFEHSFVSQPPETIMSKPIKPTLGYAMDAPHEAFVNHVLAADPTLRKTHIASTALELAMVLFTPPRFAELAKGGKITSSSFYKPAGCWVRISLLGLAAVVVSLLMWTLADHWVQRSRVGDQRAAAELWEMQYRAINEEHQKLCADIREKIATGELAVRAPAEK